MHSCYRRDQGFAGFGVPPNPGYEGFNCIVGKGDDAYDLNDIRLYMLWENYTHDNSLYCFA